MSLSTDVLAKATPTRLVCRGGRWVLELTRLEAVDRDVFQPRLTRLEGADSILALLRRSEEGQLLASGAAQLMRSPRVDEDRAFEVNEGDWVPAADGGHAPRHQPQVEAENNDLGRAVAELRAELAVLRASHARLRDRVVALEATQSGIAQPNLRPPRGARSQRRRSEPPAAFSATEAEVEPFTGGAVGDSPGFAATQASPALAAARAPSGQAERNVPLAEPAGSHQSLEDLARSIAGEQPLPVLALPGVRGLRECLQTLLEAPPPLEEQAKPTPLESLNGPLACKLLDDEGRERGAIIMDLRAALLLGAGLLAVPRDEALRQLKDNEPSEDALLATSEICNNLTGPVNTAVSATGTANDHVRSTALASVDVSALPKVRARVDLTVDGGKIILAMF